MDPATLIALFTTFAAIVQKCREERKTSPTDEELLGSARGVDGIMTIRKGLRAQGFRGRRFRVAQREAVDTLKGMSDADLLEQVINAPEAEADEDGNHGLDYDLFA